MARKRKLDSSKSSEPAEPPKKLQQQAQAELDENKPQDEPVKDVVHEDLAEYEVVEEEDDGDQDENEEDDDDEEEEEEEEDEGDETTVDNHHQTPIVSTSSAAATTTATAAAADDDDEPIQKLLEPFSKDQLINLLREAAEKHADVDGRIRMVADADPSHRKIFVHGLGWDTNTETLNNVFKQYGEIEDSKAVCDKVSGKSKGYGFILFKKRSGARKALKEPQKKIGNRMTACQLASVGPVPSSSAAVVTPQAPPASEYTQRKIYVSNVGADVDPQKLLTFFSQFGEVDEGPLGLDKVTGKPKGFCLFVYKTIESAKRALEEPHKNFEGHMLHCQRAIDGPKPGKSQHQHHVQNAPFQRNKNPNYAGGAASGSGHLMAPAGPGVGYNQGPPQALNPALGQALTALLASQGAGLGLTNLLGTLGSAAGLNPAVQGGGPGVQSGYGSQANISPGVIGYGSQSGVQGGYPNQQMGQGGTVRGGQHGVGQYGGPGGYMGH
ncbi:UBP1-associated protein 2A-like [Cucurbita pepo subsp. pepo]|uniref:UBP1-associated protein 2A-like n=1 Tax=Cucurbita pepo subsp. pepo TaxID=3664 RepID=UPI000C9D57EF|nr:UBP1-associated protein 2A-like [Cucurbita pepo subsp. pepo]